MFAWLCAATTARAELPVPNSKEAAGEQGELANTAIARARLTDAPPELWRDLDTRNYDGAVTLLMTLESRWAMEPAYNSLLAEAALAAGRYPEASLALERLVLQQPENAGALLDLAVASEALGDLETARRSLAAIERRFVVPPGIQVVVDRLRRELQVRGAPVRNILLRAGFMLGHDSNANGGLAASSLTLTPAGGAIELPVAAAYRPRASSFWLATADVTMHWDSALGALDGRLALGEKRYSSERDFDTRDIAAALAGRLPVLPETYWMAEWRRIDLGRRLLIDIPRVRVSHELATPVARCHPALGIEYEGRRYRRDLSAYDADILWIDATASCPLWGGIFTGTLRLGGDRGPASRPGGDTRRQELALNWTTRLTDRLDLMVGVIEAQARDSAGYSALIRNGIARDTDRSTLRGEMAWRFEGGWQAVVYAEQTRQSSNIGLFGIHQSLVMAGLRYRN